MLEISLHIAKIIDTRLIAFDSKFEYIVTATSVCCVRYQLKH